MNDLRNFAALQARVWEFLGQQDENTLRAIADGSMRLDVRHADDSPEVASRDPLQVARHLSELTTEHDRRRYLNATKLQVKELKNVARHCHLRGYSSLRQAGLIDLLARQGPVSVSPPPPVESNAETEHQADTQPDRTTPPDIDAAAIAARLRETETEDEGAAYLDEQRLGREGLLAVAGELQLTRLDRLSQKELRRRILKQAIGARRKFAGLRRW